MSVKSGEAQETERGSKGSEGLRMEGERGTERAGHRREGGW